MRETSIQAYEEIHKKGLLKRLQLKVYSTLFEHGPLTANEMRCKIDAESNSGVYSTRLSELERMGVVQALGKRTCQVTSKKALEWDVTKSLPSKPPKPRTKAQKKEDAIQALRGLWKKVPAIYRPDLAQLADKVKDI